MEALRKKVSCHVITYNQINYISQCIDGILMQQTNFDFEIVIGDDLSTDGTRELLQKYALQYPDLIKLNLREKRGTGIPGKDNFISTLNMCDGEYISLCDGDDFWTDPLKLQQQVDFLENNTDYSICFHNVEEVDSYGKILKERLVTSEITEKTYTIEDLAEGNFIHTASVLFRKNFNELPSWFVISPAGDYPLHMLNASYGLLKYFPKKMAAYRVGQGVWSSQSRTNQFVNTIFVIKLMLANLTLSAQAKQNFENQIFRLLLHIKDIISPDIPQQSPENIAYNLSIKRQIIILLKKIRYSF